MFTVLSEFRHLVDYAVYVFLFNVYCFFFLLVGACRSYFVALVLLSL